MLQASSYIDFTAVSNGRTTIFPARKVCDVSRSEVFDYLRAGTVIAEIS